MMCLEYLKRAKREYQNRQESVDETVTDIMLAAYEDLTGKKPSDHFREKIGDAVRFDQ
jgi:hypothetical protein